MTSTKAVAGGVAGNLVAITLWLLTLIPGWDSIPFEPKAAISSLVCTGIVAACVYFAPANVKKMPAAEPVAVE